jgi:hypothetical protein
MGFEGKLYRNEGNYASPDWSEIPNVADLSLTLEKGEADVTTRAAAGWRWTKGALKDGTVEFQMVWDADDDDVQALLSAWLVGTPIEFAVMDGDIQEAGSEGLRATMEVLKFSRGEGKEDAMMVEVAIKPTYAAQEPEWLVITE